MDTLAENFASLTNHGKSQAFGTGKRVKDAVAERNQASTAGKQSIRPSPVDPSAATAHSQRLRFEVSGHQRLAGSSTGWLVTTTKAYS